MDTGIDFPAKTFPHSVRPRVSVLSTKDTFRHNYNALTKSNYDFAIVISIVIDPGHVPMCSRVDSLAQNSRHIREKRYSRQYKVDEGLVRIPILAPTEMAQKYKK